jgi:hypothetical protein
MVVAGSPAAIDADSFADVARCTLLALAMTEPNAIFFWVAVKPDTAVVRALLPTASPRVSKTDVAVEVSIPVESRAKFVSVLNALVRSPAVFAESTISVASSPTFEIRSEEVIVAMFTLPYFEDICDVKSTP